MSNRKRIAELEAAVARLQAFALEQERRILDLQRHSPESWRYGFFRVPTK